MVYLLNSPALWKQFFFSPFPDDRHRCDLNRTRRVASKVVRTVPSLVPSLLICVLTGVGRVLKGLHIELDPEWLCGNECL